MFFLCRSPVSPGLERRLPTDSLSLEKRFEGSNFWRHAVPQDTQQTGCEADRGKRQHRFDRQHISEDFIEIEMRALVPAMSASCLLLFPKYYPAWASDDRWQCREAHRESSDDSGASSEHHRGICHGGKVHRGNIYIYIEFRDVDHSTTKHQAERAASL